MDFSFSKAPDSSQGFPDAMCEAFKRTADQLDCVVMTRTPGSAATRLIDERYDLKGFFIKSKSCDWGPMAGFVCRNPLFNKNGLSGKQFNIDQHEKYLKALKRIAPLAARTGNNKSKSYPNVEVPPDDPALTPEDIRLLGERAFLPLQISAERVSEDLPEMLDQDFFKSGERCGIAFSGDHGPSAAPSVVVEFYLHAAGTGFALYCRGVYAKVGGSYALQDDPFANGSPGAETDAPLVNADEPSAQVKAQLVLLRQQFQAKFSAPLPDPEPLLFRPICGVANPWRPYTKQKNLEKNAVSGDYDLFAVWPLLRASGLDLVRVSEIDRGAAAPGPSVRDLFLPVAKRKFAVESTVSRDVCIEFIPGYTEMATLEDVDYGNINDAVFTAAQTLNSFVALMYKGKGTIELPNAAFHSDEGGRPGVTEIELPIAVFMPERLARELAPLPPPPPVVDKKTILPVVPAEGSVQQLRAFVIAKSAKADFFGLVKLLRGRCAISLHYGWLNDLYNSPPTSENAPLTRALDEFFIGLDAANQPDTIQLPMLLANAKNENIKAETVRDQALSMQRRR